MAHLSLCSSQDDTMANFPNCDCGEESSVQPVAVADGTFNCNAPVGTPLYGTAEIEALQHAAYAEGRRDERETWQPVLEALEMMLEFPKTGPAISFARTALSRVRGAAQGGGAAEIGKLDSKEGAA